MKNLFVVMVALFLFPIGCSRDKDKEKEISTECQAVEIFNSALEKGFACTLELPPQEPISEEDWVSSCAAFTLKADKEVSALKEQGKISQEFLEDLQGRTVPLDECSGAPGEQEQDLKIFTECGQKEWAAVYKEFKTKYNCN